MTPIAAPPAGRTRRRLVVHGLVQGVGFRPFVYALAGELGLSGEVRNDSTGVVVEVEGAPETVAAFVDRLHSDAPPLAVVADVVGEEVPPRGGTGFRIGSSSRGGGRTLASPDVATCEDCLRELADPADRRYRHPFITCTNCGPRFTIITELPYDRPATTMARFPMCADCAHEYADPTDRRFHAQPIACRACGPRLELLSTTTQLRDDDAVTGARSMLAAGAVVAVKGLGGYHLACDARNERAVADLRARKRRGDKPFAVMLADVATARELADLDAIEEGLLRSPRRPVVLLARRPDAWVAQSVAPGSPDLGLLLPYTPLHTLLLGQPGDAPGPRALVMTSGNVSGEPIVTDDEDALTRLARLADAWLRHDRPIRVPCDDSVTRVVDGEELPLRRSRGYAPLPVALPIPVPASLAAGAEVKNTCAVGDGRYGWLSQHVGDMADARTVDTLSATAAHLQALTGIVPRRVVADAHPGYRSTRWARDRGAGPPVLVQHHHAHVASVMAEHGLDGSRPVIGIALDGTGFGDDGAVWGGEVLIADYRGYTRHSHLRYVPLPGGDAAVRRPYRMALAHLRAAGVDWTEDLPCVAACPEVERGVLDHQLRTGLGCVPTSSMGRLFDAVASLAGVRHVADFEAQAAVELEGRSRGSDPTPAYRFGPDLDPAPVVLGVVADVRGGVDPGVIGARFHAAVVDAVVAVAVAAREATGLGTVALSGGVFQNALLLSGVSRALTARGLTVLRHRLVPPNDGGIALGQLVIAAAQDAAAHRTEERYMPCV